MIYLYFLLFIGPFISIHIDQIFLKDGILRVWWKIWDFFSADLLSSLMWIAAFRSSNDSSNDMLSYLYISYCLFGYSFIRLFDCSFIRMFGYSVVRLCVSFCFVYSCSFIRLFVFVCLFIRISSPIRSGFDCMSYFIWNLGHSI